MLPTSSACYSQDQKFKRSHHIARQIWEIDQCQSSSLWIFYKVFSLTTPKPDIDIISVAENVESTKQSYEKLTKKFKGNPEAIFTNLPILIIITEIEGNDDGEPVYQDQKLKYTREKLYLKNHGAELIKSILPRYVERYSGVYILFRVCRVLNSAVWADLTKDTNEDEIKLSQQLNTIREIYEEYKLMPIFE